MFLVKKLKSMNYRMLLGILLIISITINIYSLSKIGSYKYRLGKQSYVDIEEIRHRNESNMEILLKSIEEGSIKNEQLLKLYKNYDVISTNIIGLWQQYNTYTQNGIYKFSKIIETNKIIDKDIYIKIKEYMSSTLNKEMKNEKNKLLLENEDLECFQNMRQMSVETYDYFNTFGQNTLNGTIGEEKEKKIIKKLYWIDMLEGIYKISDDYANVEWKIEQLDLDEIEESEQTIANK